MAFQRETFTPFFRQLKQWQASHWEQRAVVENFILDERLAEGREDSYAPEAFEDFDDWQAFHNNTYVPEKINVLRGTPETFTTLNRRNLLPEVDPDQFLIRMENLEALIKIAQLDHGATLWSDAITKFIENRADPQAADSVAEILEACNRHRDRRPLFVGFWGEVKDLFEESDELWPNKLRDRFGLGHFDPLGGEPIPILVLRYRVREVSAAYSDPNSCVAIPTVLDSSASHFFCPTPRSWTEGQTVNLTPGNADEYEFNCEILHRFIAYHPEHVYRFGRVTEPPGKSCEEARRIHLQYLEDDYEYFRFL